MRCDFVFWGAAALGGLVPVHGQDNTMRRPNILFCIADDAAWLHFGAYGCQWVSTPVFDSVAARGVLFENCYTPNAKSAPSRASLLTGRYSWQLGEAAGRMERRSRARSGPAPLSFCDRYLRDGYLRRKVILFSGVTILWHIFYIFANGRRCGYPACGGHLSTNPTIE